MARPLISAAALRSWLLPVALLVLMGLLQLLGWVEPLRYERVEVATGQWWRLLTANLVHLGWHHLLMNGLALLLLWLLFGRQRSERQWGGVLLASTLGVTGGLWLLDPALQWYVGLSGVLHGIFAAGVVGQWREDRRLALLMGAALLLKIGWEQMTGGAAATAAFVGGAVVVDAHLYGAVSGALAALLMQAVVRRGRRAG